jgi:hypothetical protein
MELNSPAEVSFVGVVVEEPVPDLSKAGAERRVCDIAQEP